MDRCREKEGGAAFGGLVFLFLAINLPRQGRKEREAIWLIRAGNEAHNLTRSLQTNSVISL
jgi:hypothetical protein